MAGKLFRSSEASAFVCARGGIAACLNAGCVNEKLERLFLLYMQLPRKFYFHFDSIYFKAIVLGLYLVWFSFYIGRENVSLFYVQET